MGRKRREIPRKVKKLATPEQLARLEEALEHFDCSYYELMDHIKALGHGNTPKIVYSMVNGRIKRTMGKGRGEVYKDCDDEEMQVWGDGYNFTKGKMNDLSDPEQAAYDGFMDAMILNGWLSYEDDE